MVTLNRAVPLAMVSLPEQRSLEARVAKLHPSL
jgi:hypothetical protein